MLRRNLQIFFLFLGAVLILILFKESQIFDLGFIFRKLTGPQKVTNQLLLPPDDLQQAYQQLLADNAGLQALAEENKELRDFFNWQQANSKLVPANLLSRDDFNQNLVIIDAGRNKGIKEGQAVVINEGVIVGKVIEVRDDASVIRMLTDSPSKLAVAVGEEQRISGLLTGSLGLGMDLSYIPQEQEVKKGDLVVTNNLNENIPAGLVIGQVEEVQFSEGELFKTASVSPLVDYSSLFLVAVIISP